MRVDAVNVGHGAAHVAQLLNRFVFDWRRDAIAPNDAGNVTLCHQMKPGKATADENVAAEHRVNYCLTLANSATDAAALDLSRQKHVIALATKHGFNSDFPLWSAADSKPGHTVLRIGRCFLLLRARIAALASL